ncbi:MAG: DNA topoisomerase IV subunit B [Burkholderiaceae bacterium]|jgi:topoisomerase-4 subunit B
MSYNEAAIRVLKGLEPVRQRPGMYTRTDSPLHIIQEVIDNAADEALGGYGQRIAVVWHADGSFSVGDEGRGIPLGLHAEEKIPVVELVFTQLHAGGKFEKGSGGAYRFSGGLHGVGVSVTNALSKRLEVTVYRDKKVGTLVFAGGEVLEALIVRPAKAGDPKNGTVVRTWPDPRYFDMPAPPLAELVRLLRSKAVLLKGITVALTIEKTDEHFEWCYANGLQGYLDDALADRELVAPVFAGDMSVDPARDDAFAEGEGAAWAITFAAEGHVVRESFVNLIPTPAGGTHEAGLRDGVFQAVRSFCDLHAILPKGVKLLPEDVFSRACFVLSAKVLDPQFQGQIKEKLNTRDALRLVSGLVKPAMDLWLNDNLDAARRIAELAVRQAQARTREAQRVEKRKSSSVAVLPGKLTDCESTDLQRNEVFLVEGDSAGGSAKMGRDKAFQAILPLRGKVLNAWETDRDRLFANQEIHDIAVAIGLDPHESGTAVDMSNLRYGKVCILSDADVDGSHIQVLLLTLFYRHFPGLIEQGCLYVARPPLFRVDAPAHGKRPARKIYCLDEQELVAVKDKLAKEGVKPGALQISRFKGLGEMNASQLWETTLNPDTRRLLPVGLGSFGITETRAMMHMLMGRNEAAARRAWLEEKGNLAEVDI